MRSLILTTCFFLSIILVYTCVAEEFPYREKYPELNIIELTELKLAYEKGQIVIIDLRSEVEFNTIHIKGAINLPYGHAKFTNQLSIIKKQNPNKKIAVYDNGINCIKSYKAGEDALYDMIQDVYVFDAGITAWAKTYPSATLLLEKELINPDTQLIRAKKSISKYLDIDTFMQKARSHNAVIIDVRDPIQRTQKLPGLEDAMLIPIKKLVENIIQNGHMKNKELYIFDQVGRQVKWLMYHLVDNGYTDYYFLDGGATTVLKEQVYRVSSFH